MASDVSETICAGLMEGETLTEICADPEMPEVSMVMRWLEVNQTFREQHAWAVEVRQHLLMDEMVELADDPRRPIDQARSAIEVLQREVVKLDSESICLEYRFAGGSTWRVRIGGSSRSHF